MIARVWVNPAEPGHAMAHAATAAVIAGWIAGKGRSLSPSMRNLLDASSVAQRLDGKAV
jgi:hypothetical protein